MRAKLAAYSAILGAKTFMKLTFLVNCHTPEVRYQGSVGASVLVHRSTGTGAATGLGSMVCNPGFRAIRQRQPT
jgi:hypothetical protein